jgi:Family of unknown function (DUF6445)
VRPQHEQGPQSGPPNASIGAARRQLRDHQAYQCPVLASWPPRRSLISASLTPVGEDAGETVFYRHRRTGLQILPNQPSREVASLMRKDGFDPLSGAAYTEFVRHLMYESLEKYASPSLGTGIIESNEVWEVVGRLPGAFNRLVAFPGRAFHSPAYQPRTAEHKSRLTLNFSFMPI